jgi:thiol-disulfide isomerase/thioredoxin
MTASTVVAVAVAALAAVVVGLQVAVALRARAMRGAPVPSIPGPLGAKLAGAPRALLYFFSPGCAACRSLTPRFAALGRARADVHLIDVSDDLGAARALKVMATPSVVEIGAGRIVAYHVGPPPRDLLDRWSR